MEQVNEINKILHNCYNAIITVDKHLNFLMCRVYIKETMQVEFPFYYDNNYTFIGNINNLKDKIDSEIIKLFKK